MAGRGRKSQEHNEFNIALGERICKLRKEAGVGYYQFARALGLKHQQVYAYETGRTTIPPHLLVLMAHVLKVGVADLMPVLG